MTLTKYRAIRRGEAHWMDRVPMTRAQRKRVVREFGNTVTYSLMEAGLHLRVLLLELIDPIFRILRRFH